jgi:hypothetical protein
MLQEISVMLLKKRLNGYFSGTSGYVLKSGEKKDTNCTEQTCQILFSLISSSATSVSGFVINLIT